MTETEELEDTSVNDTDSAEPQPENNSAEEQRIPAVWRVVLILGALAVAAFALAVFFYTDLTDSLDNGVMLGEVIAQGRITDYYRYAALNHHPMTVYSANYNILVYALFALWNLPTVILHLTNGFDYMTSVPAIIWSKMMIPFFILLGCAGIHKLVLHMTNDRRDAFFGSYLYAVSAMTFMSAFVALQYDCIELAFMIWAIYFLATGRKKRGFLLFALALPFKSFSLFLLVPALLIETRNIGKTILGTALCAVPLLLSEMPFRGDEYYRFAVAGQGSDAVDLILEGSMLGKHLNLFVFAAVLLGIFCYAAVTDTQEKKTYLTVYAAFAIFASFAVFVSIRSYWLILLAPFLSILLAANPARTRTMQWAAVFGNAAGTLYFLMHHWIYGEKELCRTLLLKNLGPAKGFETEYGSFRDMCLETGLADYAPVLFAVFAAVMVYFLIVLRPKKEAAEALTETDRKADLISLSGSLLTDVLIAVLLVFFAFKTMPAVISSREPEEVNKETPQMLIDENAYTGEVMFTRKGVLTRFEMPVAVKEFSRKARSAYDFSLCDSERNEIWHTIYGLKKEAETIKIRIPSVPVEPDKTYSLTIREINEDQDYDMELYGYTDAASELVFCFR